MLQPLESRFDAGSYAEETTWIECGGKRLPGILARPHASSSNCAVLIVVGGPQYRVGSHRQFTLLARCLAAHGVATLRFDCRGMGDGDGAQRDFEQIEDDVAAALDQLAGSCPQARKLVVWGLCDAASAALMFCTGDSRVAGLVLANPWVRSEATLAQTHLRHYYPKRLLQRDFWAKVLRGGFDWSRAFRALRETLRARRGGASAGGTVPRSFRERMAQGWRDFRGRILLIVSGDDLTAREFIDLAGSSPAWHGLLSRPNVERFDMPEANHTFSSAAWRAAVEARTLQWLGSL
jgi:uncharacterized protein